MLDFANTTNESRVAEYVEALKSDLVNTASFIASCVEPMIRPVIKKAVLRMPETRVANVLLMGEDRVAKSLDVVNWRREVLICALLMVVDYDAVFLVVITVPGIRKLVNVALMEVGESAMNRDVYRRHGLTRINVLLTVVDHDV